MMKTRVVSPARGRFRKFSPQPLLVIFGIGEHLKDGIFTDASSFCTSDFNAKPSCYILKQNGKTALDICTGWQQPAKHDSVP